MGFLRSLLLFKQVLTGLKEADADGNHPVLKHGNHDKSEADGARTRNHRIDSPVL
jgi:hypothetical protein